MIVREAAIRIIVPSRSVGEQSRAHERADWEGQRAADFPAAPCEKTPPSLPDFAWNRTFQLPILRHLVLLIEALPMPRIQFHRLLVGLLIVSCLAGGCVRRRMTIRSNPPGATVYVDDQPIGTTPASSSFVYYGTRKIQLVKDGYETLTVKHKFAPPWYQIPPLDFISENLVPTELRDERILELELEPQRLVSVPELMDRAQQLRDSSRLRVRPAATGTPYYEPPSGELLPPSDAYPPAYSPPPAETGDGRLPPAYFPDR